jgi:hypothetical protein
MSRLNKTPNMPVDSEADDVQVDKETGEPIGIAPEGELTEDEIAEKDKVSPDDALRIDPKSRIPRPVQPDLA